MKYADAKRALCGERLPALVVDLDAFERNLDRHLAVTGVSGLPLRVATKSVRVVSLLERVLARKGCRGLMCYSPREAALLAQAGFDDLLVAYPPFRACDVEPLVTLSLEGKTVSVAVDSKASVDHLARLASARSAELPVVLCVDMSLRPFKGRVHVGVRRSPLHTVEDAVELALHARATSGVRVHGVLGYEAQVAGLGDASPHDNAVLRAGKRWVRKASMEAVTERRTRLARELERLGFTLAFVNGGGSGSLDLTTPDTGVTEVTAGSGLLKPMLFDGYSSDFVRSLEPACFFALEVTRRPAVAMVTCFGGGYVASGATGPDRLPRPYLPEGLELIGAEGAGEVQTPVTGAAASGIELGDPVLFRHAKAGELMERFDEALLVRGDAIVERARTYRGQGWTFG